MKLRQNIFLLIGILTIMNACIGTDILPDPEDITMMEGPVPSGDLEKSSMFRGRSGYDGEGTAVLTQMDGQLTLMLLEDFRTSFALGTFVYLSNFTNGAETRANGLELGEITMNGAHSFDVTSIAEMNNTSVSIQDYRYVIILCKPASITFAIADLDE